VSTAGWGVPLPPACTAKASWCSAAAWAAVNKAPGAASWCWPLPVTYTAIWCSVQARAL
jgi:hypothetical protein